MMRGKDTLKHRLNSPDILLKPFAKFKFTNISVRHLLLLCLYLCIFTNYLYQFNYFRKSSNLTDVNLKLKRSWIWHLADYLKIYFRVHIINPLTCYRFLTKVPSFLNLKKKSEIRTVWCDGLWIKMNGTIIRSSVYTT